MSDDNKTLFLASADLARKKKAPKPAGTSRGPTSDVTRFRGVLAAALAGAVGLGAAAFLLPPPGGHLAPGALAKPHKEAGLACSACHTEGFSAKPGQALVPSSACQRCHGEHGTLRPGHARALESGAMRCATCHTIHRGEEGVAFAPGAAPVRFGPGVETVAEVPVAFHADKPTTVAIVPKKPCAGCHDLAAELDPAARCFAGGADFVTCFDEHQALLPDTKNAALLGSGVCSGQHGTDRGAAWEAARTIARETKLIPAGKKGTPWSWAAAAFASALFAFVIARLGWAARARRAARKTGKASLVTIEKPAERVRLPQIDVSTCLGCSACVDACPYDVLEVEKYVAKVARPEACCGLTLCEQRCPNGSLKITEGEPVGDRPRLADSLESEDVPGLFLAGDVTGLPLIKNAIAQGARATDAVQKSLANAGPRPAATLDLIIVGAGPAGLSAALRAQELGLAFEVIEQGSVAQSIRSFPRGKLVFDQPLELPVAGQLWLEESTKEELLSHWMRIVRREKLPILEDLRVVDVQRGEAGFSIAIEPREGGARTFKRSRRLILAIGQRGTPRRLPFEVDVEVESRVHYHLFDAKSFERKKVVVVGLGDVAMEAVIALARQPGTEVTVIHRQPSFSRGKSRNIAEIRRLAASGRISLRFATEIAAARADALDLCAGGVSTSVAWDALLVLIGSIPPWATLRSFGVRSHADLTRREDPSPSASVDREQGPPPPA